MYPPHNSYQQKSRSKATLQLVFSYIEYFIHNIILELLSFE